MPAHRMRECKIRWWAIRQHHLAHETFEVPIVFGEIGDVCLPRVYERAVGSALASPIHDCNGEAASPHIGNHLEVFLDEFAPAREATYGAALRAACRVPAREAHRSAVMTLEGADEGAARNRISGERDQFHDAPCRNSRNGCGSNLKLGQGDVYSRPRSRSTANFAGPSVTESTTENQVRPRSGWLNGDASRRPHLTQARAQTTWRTCAGRLQDAHNNGLGSSRQAVHTSLLKEDL